MSEGTLVQDVTQVAQSTEKKRQSLPGKWLTKVKEFLWGAPRTTPTPVWRSQADSQAALIRENEGKRIKEWIDHASDLELVPADLEQKRLDAEDPAMQAHARAVAAAPNKGGLFLKEPLNAKGMLTELVARKYKVPLEVAAQTYPILRKQLIADEGLGLDNISDEGLVLHLQGVNQLEHSLASLAVDAGIEGVPWRQAYVAIKPSIEKSKFYGVSLGIGYQGMFKLVHANSARLSKQVRPDVEKVIAAFETPGSVPEFGELMSHFRGKSDEQLAMMWQMLEKHEFAAPHKNFFDQSGQAVGRSFRDLYKGVKRSTYRWNLEVVDWKLRPGRKVPKTAFDRGPEGIVDYLETENTRQASALIKAAWGFASEPSLGKSTLGRSDTPLGDQDVEAAKKTIATRRDDTVLDAKLQRFADEEVDPIKGDNWFTEYLYYPALKSSAYTVASMLPYGLGLPFVYAANVDTEYNRLIESGVDHDVAMADSAWVGGVQTGVDRVQALFGLGRVPKLGRVRLPTLTASGVARQWAKDLFLITVAETGTEQTQQYLIPALRDSIRKDNGDVDWLAEDGPLVQALVTAPRTAGAVLLLGMVGSTRKQFNDVGAAREFLQNKHTLMQLRYSEEQAGEISRLATTDLKQSIEKARTLWSQRAGTVETAAAAGQLAQQQMEAEARGVAELEASGVVPRIQANHEGTYTLLLPEGGGLEFATYEEADAERWNIPEVRRWEIHESLREAIANSERNLKPGESRQFILRGAEEAMTAERRLAEMPENTPEERAAKDKLRKTLEDRVKTDQVMDGPATEIEAYNEGAAMNTVAKDADTARIAAIILGESVTEFKEGVWLNTVKLYRGASAATVVEETLEGNASRILQSEGGSRWMLKAVRDAEQALGSPLLRTKNDAEVTASDLKEAFSALGVGMFMDEASAGNERLKTNARWLSEEQRRLVGNTRLGLVYDAFARKMQAAFRRAEGLGKLRRDGQLDARLEEELAKALGIDPKVVEGGKEGVADGTDLTTDAEAQAMQSADAVADGGDADAAVGPSAEGELGEASFSLKPHNRTDLDSLVKEAAQPGNAPSWAETSLPDAQRTLLERVVGHSLDGYIRAVDLSGVRHVDKRHGSRSNDPHPVTEADLAALPEIVAAPGAVMLSSDSGKNVATIQHVRFHDGYWYYYTEDVRGGKNGLKALVLVSLRKSPGKQGASDQTSSAEAGSVTSETLLAEAEDRLRRSNENFKGNREPRARENGADGDVSAQTSQVFLDDGLGEVTQPAGTDLAEGSEALGVSTPKGNSATDKGADVPEVSFSIEPAAVGRWVNKQQAVEPPVVKLPHGGESQLINFAKGLWAKLPSTVQSRDGRTVTLKHNLQGTEEVLFEHLTTSHDKTGRIWVDRARVKSILRITSTIENARPRFIAENGNHIYIQRYADGFNHYVVTKPDGLVVEHGLSDTLQTQWLRPQCFITPRTRTPQGRP